MTIQEKNIDLTFCKLFHREREKKQFIVQHTVTTIISHTKHFSCHKQASQLVSSFQKFEVFTVCLMHVVASLVSGFEQSTKKPRTKREQYFFATPRTPLEFVNHLCFRSKDLIETVFFLSGSGMFVLVI